jgi:hypothetical protein
MDVHIKRKHGDRGYAIQTGSSSIKSTSSRFVSYATDFAKEHRDDRSAYANQHEAYHRQNTPFDSDLSPKKKDDFLDQIMEDIRKYNELTRQLAEFRETSVKASSFQIPPWQLAVLMASNNFLNKNTAVTRKAQLPTGYRVSVCDKCLSGQYYF